MAVVSCMFVVVSTLCLIVSTLPMFQQKDANGIARKCIQKKEDFHSVNLLRMHKKQLYDDFTATWRRSKVDQT